MFITGPAVIKSVTAEEVTPEQLGGRRIGLTVEHPFERNLLLVLAIRTFGAENDGHAAATKFIDDPVAANGIARLRQGLGFAMANQ